VPQNAMSEEMAARAMIFTVLQSAVL
jgi:hypothetical protein